jgi:hypothetical protein
VLPVRVDWVVVLQKGLSVEGFKGGYCVVCGQTIKYCPGHDKRALYRKIMKQNAELEKWADYHKKNCWGGVDQLNF